MINLFIFTRIGVLIVFTIVFSQLILPLWNGEKLFPIFRGWKKPALKEEEDKTDNPITTNKISK